MVVVTLMLLHVAGNFVALETELATGLGLRRTVIGSTEGASCARFVCVATNNPGVLVPTWRAVRTSARLIRHSSLITGLRADRISFFCSATTGLVRSNLRLLLLVDT
jgi:hypothetical protein